MKIIRILILLTWTVLVLAGCKKDKIDNGPFAIEAKDFLSAKKYESLVIEVCYVDGYAPEQTALDHLKNFLAQRLNKPDGITFTYKSIGNPQKNSFDVEALKDIEKDHRSEFTKGDQLAVFAFFANAPYSNGNTLGVVYGTTSFAMFEKTIQDNSGGLGQPTQTVLEATVLEHEFGHLMGLVDSGTPMVSAHAANDHHCSNNDCLMYYAVETLDFIGNLTGGDIPELDANCIADLQANGGK